MNNTTTNTSDNEQIEKTVQYYIDGAKSGKGDDMRPGVPRRRDYLWIYWG